MWDPSILVILLSTMTLVAVVRGSMLIVTVLRAMSGHFHKDGGAKFMLANNVLNNIDDYLEYRYKGHSAQDQRDTILKMIDEYRQRMKVLASKQSNPTKAS